MNHPLLNKNVRVFDADDNYMFEDCERTRLIHVTDTAMTFKSFYHGDYPVITHVPTCDIKSVDDNCCMPVNVRKDIEQILIDYDIKAHFPEGGQADEEAYMKQMIDAIMWAVG